MSNVYAPEPMEQNSYWERQGTVEPGGGAIHGKGRLGYPLHDCSKINKRLENLGYKPAFAEMSRNCKRFGKKKDGDEMSVASSYNEPESSNEDEDEVDETKSKPSPRRKHKEMKQVAAGRKNYKESKRRDLRKKAGKKVGKSNLQFVREPMEEDSEEEDKNIPYRRYPKLNSYVRGKKKLTVKMGELKRKKRNGNVKRHEKKFKSMRTRGKNCKTKKLRKKIDRESIGGGNTDEKPDQKSQNQEHKVEVANTNETSGKVNNGDIKKNSGKEVSVSNKCSQDESKFAGNAASPPKLEKEHANGDCSKDAKPKENDTSKMGEVNQKMAAACWRQGPPEGYLLRRLNRNILEARRKKHKCSRHGKRRISPFIKFYITVYKELCNTCSITSIAREAGKRWRRMTRKEKLKFYPKKP